MTKADLWKSTPTLQPTKMSQSQVLIVDDELNVRRSLKGILEDEGYAAETAASGEECLKIFEKKSFDVVLLDVWMPGKDGLEVLEDIKRSRPGQFVIMISGHGTIETAVRATKLGAFDFIEKPLSLEKVILVLEHAFRQRALEEENRSLKDFIRRETVMIGNSIPMQALRQQIDYAAPTEGRVLIYGENGTGKELVARLLHLRSSRSERAFVEVNCAAIPDDLIESELFGNTRGAFTGATEARKGKFALADRGTLFLDEVGDMSLKTQAKVLRMLEEQRFYPVGANKPIEVDVRVISATNKDLEEEIQNGDFREDLFFRLNVIPFEVPPLRERREDVLDLLDFFVDLYCRKYGKAVKRFTPEALEVLKSYRWPGNVRELKNIVERLAIMLQRVEIESGDLPRSILEQDGERSAMTKESLHAAREEFERAFIGEKLRQNEGNVSRTATAIGMERTHLHRKIKTLKIRP